MMMTVRALDAQRPLPSASSELLRIADGVTLIEADDGSGSVFLWGSVGWTWAAGDRVARRLAAVQLVATKAAPQRRVAAAFGVNEDTLILWRGQYAMNGVAGLAGRRPGPKGPSKLTEAKRSEISALRAEGLTMHAVAERVSVSTDSVRRALARGPHLETTDEAVGGPALVPPRRPSDRSVDDQATRSGSITGIHPVARDGSALPLGGVLTILPALEATELLDAAVGAYDSGATTFAGLRTPLLSTVFACLLGELRVEGAMRLDPTVFGRLLGLDRPLESDTMHRQLQELATLGRADLLINALAHRHLAAHNEAEGIFHFDGDVHGYRRSAEVAKDDLARIRMSIGADLDISVLDREGDGVLLWTAPPEASVIGHLRAVLTKVRDLAGPRAHPTICFERGGWPLKLFAELAAAGFDIVAFGKGSARAEPVTSFHRHWFTDGTGRVHPYLLADGEARIGDDNGRRPFPCREIVALDPDTGQQTQILTTRGDPDPAPIAHTMFYRWSHEHFIDDTRAQHGIDARDSYGSIEPAVNDVGPDAASLRDERQRIHEAVRMAAYNAESALARLLVPRHARSGDEARCLLREAFRTSAELQIMGDQLHVRLEPLSTSRACHAIDALCAELTTTKTVYPGSTLTLVYSTEADVDME